MSNICISLYLGVHREFINTNTDQIQQNLQMTLTYILNGLLQLQGQGQIYQNWPAYAHLWDKAMMHAKY